MPPTPPPPPELPLPPMPPAPGAAENAARIDVAGTRAGYQGTVGAGAATTTTTTTAIRSTSDGWRGSGATRAAGLACKHAFVVEHRHRGGVGSAGAAASAAAAICALCFVRSRLPRRRAAGATRIAATGAAIAARATNGTAATATAAAAKSIAVTGVTATRTGSGAGRPRQPLQIRNGCRGRRRRRRRRLLRASCRGMRSSMPRRCRPP